MQHSHALCGKHSDEIGWILERHGHLGSERLTAIELSGAAERFASRLFWRALPKTSRQVARDEETPLSGAGSWLNEGSTQGADASACSNLPPRSV